MAKLFHFRVVNIFTAPDEIHYAKEYSEHGQAFDCNGERLRNERAVAAVLPGSMSPKFVNSATTHDFACIAQEHGRNMRLIRSARPSRTLLRDKHRRRASAGSYTRRPEFAAKRIAEPREELRSLVMVHLARPIFCSKTYSSHLTRTSKVSTAFSWRGIRIRPSSERTFAIYAFFTHSMLNQCVGLALHDIRESRIWQRSNARFVQSQRLLDGCYGGLHTNYAVAVSYRQYSQRVRAAQSVASRWQRGWCFKLG
jgi:hypothetical protein